MIDRYTAIMVLRAPLRIVLAVLAVLLPAAAGLAAAQPITPFNRLPSHVLDVRSPSDRVVDAPGDMSFVPVPCRTLPIAAARQRIVHVAVQEWGFFGFPIVEYDADDDDVPGRGGGGEGSRRGGPGGTRGRGAGRVGTPEAARTAASIGGYWAVAPGGAWILESQNQYWREAVSGVTRWRFPWSAAFISWVMCEGGLGDAGAFQPAIAHHTYIDQAIRARDGAAPRAAYVAHDAGEAPIAPGDMLCTSRRPLFRTLADRRRQMGQGARTHCDIVVKVDEAAGQILAIGGNVRGVVGLKMLPAIRTPTGLRPSLPERLANSRPVFAHLRLRGEPSVADAFDSSPTIRALTCTVPDTANPVRMLALRRLIPSAGECAE